MTKWNAEYKKNEELKYNLLEFPVRNDGPSMLPENEEAINGYELPRIQTANGPRMNGAAYGSVGTLSTGNLTRSQASRGINSAKPLG